MVCVIAAGIFIVFRGRGGGSVAAPAVVGENVIYQGAIKAILDGEYDDLPEDAFYMVGSIEDAIEKAKTL